MGELTEQFTWKIPACKPELAFAPQCNPQFFFLLSVADAGTKFAVHAAVMRAIVLQLFGWLIANYVLSLPPSLSLSLPHSSPLQIFMRIGQRRAWLHLGCMKQKQKKSDFLVAQKALGKVA